jgi:hypothetical protein
MYDRKLVRNAITDITATIKEMKVRKHESKQPRWTYTDEWALTKAKARATVLCCITAQARGRLHHKKTAEDQAAYLEKNALVTKEFLRKEEVAAA